MTPVTPLSNSHPLHVALFGTSADPPTLGHQVILQWLACRFDHVAVWAADNPFKSHQASLAHRESMLRLIIGDSESVHPNLQLYPDLSSPRTVITIGRAQQHWPTSALTLVVGSDILAQLHKWYEVKHLLSQVDLLVIPRPGYPADPDVLQHLREMGARLQLADLTGPDVSSTAYREEGNLDALTTPVQDYICRQHLYTCRDQAPPNMCH
jgi:nicotinate-nucleotide adenylyltransferase